MERDAMIARRELMIASATIAAATPATIAATAALAEVPPGPNVTLTIERRGQVALFGLHRPDVQNRVDPETFQALARALYDYDNDPSLRAAILFGHGADFSRGVDVEAYRAASGTGGPLPAQPRIINPLNYGQARRTKPLIAAVHGDTWNMGHELFLAADIRVAAADTNFGQDENTHGRFPGGGSTIRFVREAGWGNAMRYMLTGDHWTAADAYHMGMLQEIAGTPQAAFDRAMEIAGKVAACAPLGVRTTLASAHLAIDAAEAEAFSRLGAQYGALYRTRDFLEGVAAQAEGRAPVFQGD